MNGLGLEHSAANLFIRHVPIILRAISLLRDSLKKTNHSLIQITHLGLLLQLVVHQCRIHVDNPYLAFNCPHYVEVTTTFFSVCRWGEFVVRDAMYIVVFLKLSSCNNYKSNT